MVIATKAMLHHGFINSEKDDIQGWTELMHPVSMNISTRLSVTHIRIQTHAKNDVHLFI